MHTHRSISRFRRRIFGCRLHSTYMSHLVRRPILPTFPPRAKRGTAPRFLMRGYPLSNRDRSEVLYAPLISQIDQRYGTYVFHVRPPRGNLATVLLLRTHQSLALLWGVSVHVLS